ncbi:MAG: isochorismatase family protein [Bacteroidales bacterium]|nr:isochorismatase family protein [Bacteroidales bacterium]
MEKKLIIVIDAQNDFADPKGALYVEGGYDCAQRIGSYLYRCNDRGNTVVWLSMDSHRGFHISHPSFWMDKETNEPEPFTDITMQDLKSGKYKPVMNYALAKTYLELLEESGVKHTVWPPHCIMDTWGWRICVPVRIGIGGLVSSPEKERGPFGGLELIHKGDNMFTDQFSIFRAVCEYKLFPDTCLRTDLIKGLKEYDEIYVCGFCTDICVKASIADIVKHAPEQLPKLRIMSDATVAYDEDFNITEDPVYQEAVKGGGVIGKGREFNLFKRFNYPQ